MMKYKILALVAILFAVLPAFGADATQPPVKRPTTPDAKTLTPPTSQIAAWYRYAVYVESLLADRDAQIDSLKNGDPAANAKLDAILTQLTAITEKLTGNTTPNPPNPPKPPVITPPGPNEARVGATVTFTATADGTDPLTWQWRKNGDPVSGWTSPVLTLPSVTTNDTATYTVTVKNDAGSADASFQLTVIP